jgi:hypothetical protein
MVNATETTDRTISLGNDILIRLDNIIDAMNGGSGGNGGGNSSLPTIKNNLFNNSTGFPSSMILDTTDGWIYKIRNATSGLSNLELAFTANSANFDFSREIYIFFDNSGDAEVVVSFVSSDSTFVYMDSDVWTIPVNATLEVSLMSLDDGTIRVISKMQNNS